MSLFREKAETIKRERLCMIQKGKSSRTFKGNSDPVEPGNMTFWLCDNTDSLLRTCVCWIMINRHGSDRLVGSFPGSKRKKMNVSPSMDKQAKTGFCPGRVLPCTCDREKCSKKALHLKSQAHTGQNAPRPSRTVSSRKQMKSFLVCEGAKKFVLSCSRESRSR